MPARVRVLLACACALAAVLTTSASAATVETFRLDEPNAAVVAASDGTLHAVERDAQADVVLNPDGTVRHRVELPAPVAASRAVAAGPGGVVWIAVDLTPGAPAFARVDGEGRVTTVPVAPTIRCPINAVAADPASGTVTFSAPLNPPGDCGTHGLATIWPDGSVTPFADGGVSAASALAFLGGRLFVGDGPSLRRYAWAGAPAPEATVRLFDTVSALTVGGDGQLYGPVPGWPELARVAPDAPDGADAARIQLGSGAKAVTGNPVTNVAVVGGADESITTVSASAAAEALPVPGLKGGNHVATLGEDTWVTNAVTSELHRLIDTRPAVRITSGSGLPVTYEVLPRGNVTHWELTAVQGSTGLIRTGRAEPNVGNTALPPTFADLGPGQWTIRLAASNRRGASVATATVTVPSPAPRPKPQPAKPPKFASVVSLASGKRCVANRALVLKVRDVKSGGGVSTVSVKVGKAKAKVYGGDARRKPIAIRGLPKKGTAKVKVVVTLFDGTKVNATRTFRACAPKAKHKKKTHTTKKGR